MLWLRCCRGSQKRAEPAAARGPLALGVGFKAGFGRTERRRKGPQQAEESRAGDWDISESAPVPCFDIASLELAPGQRPGCVWASGSAEGTGSVSSSTQASRSNLCHLPPPSGDAPGGLVRVRARDAFHDPPLSPPRV